MTEEFGYRYNSEMTRIRAARGINNLIFITFSKYYITDEDDFRTLISKQTILS